MKIRMFWKMTEKNKEAWMKLQKNYKKRLFDGIIKAKLLKMNYITGKQKY